MSLARCVCLHVFRGCCIIQSQFGLHFLHIHKLRWHFPISQSCCPCLCEHFVTAAVPLDTVSSWAEIGQDLHSLTPHQIFFVLDSINKAWVAGYPLTQTLSRMLKQTRPCSERWPQSCSQLHQETRRGLHHPPIVC